MISIEKTVKVSTATLRNVCQNLVKINNNRDKKWLL